MCARPFHHYDRQTSRSLLSLTRTSLPWTGSLESDAIFWLITWLSKKAWRLYRVPGVRAICAREIRNFYYTRHNTTIWMKKIPKWLYCYFRVSKWQNYQFRWILEVEKKIKKQVPSWIYGRTSRMDLATAQCWRSNHFHQPSANCVRLREEKELILGN